MESLEKWLIGIYFTSLITMCGVLFIVVRLVR